jgi:hypothetical protein
MAQQAIHWARLAAKNDPNTFTILIIPDINWYQNYSPHTGPFPDTHTMTHFAADTITYPPTPYNIIVNKNTKWNKLLYPPHTNRPTTQAPPIPTYEINTTLKFPPQYSYYTDGSFIPPKQVENMR